MIADLDIPEKLQSTFRRVMKKVPSELKENVEFQKILSLYFKIGGEKLARQRIDMTKKKFQDGYLLIKRLVPEQVQDESSEEETEASPESPQDSENEENKGAEF